MKKGYTYFIRKLYRKKTINKINEKVKLLGCASKTSAEKLLFVRLIFSFIIFFGFLICLVDWFYALGIMIIYYFGFNYLIDYNIKKRGRELEDDSLLFFEVLGLSLESGKDLISALKITTDSIDSKISLEFKHVLYEVKYGKSLTEALNSLKKRIPSDVLNNVILSMIECHMSGGNLISTLNEQVDYIRSIKKMDIKERINRLPIQISVVSVVFVVPMILILLLGPVILEYLVSLS